MTREYPINDYDLRGLLGGPSITVVRNRWNRDGKFEVLKGGSRQRVETWEGAVKLAGAGDRWFLPNGRSQMMFPLAAVVKAQKMKIHWAKKGDHTLPGTAVKFTEGRPCEQVVNRGDSRWSNFQMCFRIATGTSSGRWRGQDEIPTCAVHLGAVKRASDAAAERRREAEACNDQRRREQEMEQAITDSIERLQPLLEQLGINPQTIAYGEHNGRQGILLPAEALEDLVRRAVEFEEMMQS